MRTRHPRAHRGTSLTFGIDVIPGVVQPPCHIDPGEQPIYVAVTWGVVLKPTKRDFTIKGYFLRMTELRNVF